MRNDDLDYEELNRGKKAKDAMSASMIKHIFAPLVAADSLKNAALSRDTSVKEAWNRIKSDYPDSAFENPTEGIDVINSHFPKFSSESPNTAAALGLGVDILDPISYGATKLLSKAKIPLTLAQATMAAGDRMANSGVESWVKKNIKKTNMNDVPKLVDYIKKNNLRGELRNPEKIIKTIDGTYDSAGKKATEGTLDAVGQKISSVVRRADLKGAKEVNRGDIYRSMKKSVEQQNASPDISGVTKKEPYLAKLRDTIKPFQKETKIIEGMSPDRPMLTPAIPKGDVEARIAALELEASKAKEAKKFNITDEPIDVENVQKAQAKERLAAESKVGKTNAQIEAENKKLDEELVSHLFQREAKNNPPPLPIKPMDMIPEPKAQKGLPAIPAQEALDIKLHNEKAAQTNKKYLEQNRPKVDNSADLEAKISELESKPRKPLEQVDVPPPMPKEAFNVNPPPIPADAKGRDLESVLAELSDARSSKKNLEGANKSINLENSSSLKNYGLDAKANAPKAITREVDRISNLESLHRLKVDARKKLRQADWDASIKNLPEHKQMVMDATQRIDNEITSSLKDINLPEGNAADIYESLKGDYGTQNDFLEMVIDDTINNWKGGKFKGGALPALTGGAAAAVAAKMSGGSIPLSTVAGSVAGEAGRRGILSNYPAIKASIGNRLASPEAAHIATQTTTAIPEKIMNHKTEGHDRELENQALAPGEHPSIGEGDMSPEVKALIDRHQGRNPQSEPMPTQDMSQHNGDPIDQKMSETLTPPKPVWDPYTNEQVLNTFLPRDSKRIMDNPTALMAKIHQVAPNQVQIVQDMLDNDKEGMAEAGPKIAMMFPTMFEKDKYDAFDGKIIDPKMQQKFLSDLSQDEGMDSIEKADLAMRVHRGESIK